jgi:hypothetical protein
VSTPRNLSTIPDKSFSLIEPETSTPASLTGWLGLPRLLWSPPAQPPGGLTLGPERGELAAGFWSLGVDINASLGKFKILVTRTGSIARRSMTSVSL